MLTLGLAVWMMSGPDYIAEELKWRAARETSLKAPKGWLSVAGLFWLEAGANAVGSAKDSRVALPERLTAHAGEYIREDSKITFRAADGTETVALAGPGATPSPIHLDKVVLTIIERGPRIGVRMYDPQSKAQRAFKGLAWYAINPSYRIEAKYVAYPEPKILPITNVLGDVDDTQFPGYVEFTLHGQSVRLEAQTYENELFFNFRDTTAGKKTYGAGRFLYTDAPKNGKVILDFNRATCPPCAYTAFATCPLPPAPNRLNVAIEAGELAHHPPED